MRLKTFHLVADFALVVGGIGFGIAGYPVGFLVAIVGILMLVFSQVDPILRWQVNRHYRSLFGRAVTVDIDDTGLRFANDLMASQVPWSTLTSVRSTEHIVVFLREHAILGYVPATAFRSHDEQQEFVRYACDRIASEPRAS